MLMMTAMVILDVVYDGWGRGREWMGGGGDDGGDANMNQSADAEIDTDKLLFKIICYSNK